MFPSHLKNGQQLSAVIKLLFVIHYDDIIEATPGVSPKIG